MLVTESALQLRATHQSQERHERRESLTAWVGEGESRRTTTATHVSLNGQSTRAIQTNRPQVSISPLASQLQPQKALLNLADPDLDRDLQIEQVELEFSLVKSLVESFSGFKIEIITIDDVKARVNVPAQRAETPTPARIPAAAESENSSVGWGMVYDFYESHHESETTQFTTKGTIQTADGKQVTVDLELNMSREFISETRINLRAGDALKDPLVVNFTGNAAELTQRKYSFDIDADGQTDQIAFVKPGSGFLALDKDGDGVIRVGSELLGAISGDGFAELAAFDGDENGWIDEGDNVYDRLRIWSKDAEGNDHLMALGKRGVGAIYLGHTSTPFLLKGDENQTLGMVKESGVFLSEEGEAGSIQQIDLVV